MGDAGPGGRPAWSGQFRKAGTDLLGRRRDPGLPRLEHPVGLELVGERSPTNLLRDLDGVSQPTLDRSLTYLEQTFLIV